MGDRPGNRSHIQKYPEQATSKLGRVGLDDSTLQALQDASSRALQTFADLPFYNQGIPTQIQQKDYKANIREAVRVDPTNGAFTVFLPEIKSNMVGGAVFVVNITSNDSTTVTISPGGSDTIDGQTSYPIVGAYNYAMFWAAEEGNWIVESIRVPAAQTYTPSNVSTDRSYDADSTTVDELADVLGTLIADLQALGLIG